MPPGFKNSTCKSARMGLIYFIIKKKLVFEEF